MNPRILAVSDVFKISAFVFLGGFCTALSVFMRVWMAFGGFGFGAFSLAFFSGFRS